MIVRAVDDHLHLITQPDHARLAGAMMERCTALASHPRRSSILRAISEHDNGWAEEDAAPATDPATGAVVDFIHAPLDVRYAVWPRGVARLDDDPWVAALVAEHALAVHERTREEPDWAPFFAKMTAMRDRLVTRSGLPLDSLVSDYPFVRLADLISLVFCNGWVEEHTFGKWTIQLSGARVTTAPDPFGGAVIPLAVTARVIPNRRWASDSELSAALDQADTTIVRGEAAGAQ